MVLIKKIATIVNLDLCKYYVEIDEQRHTRENVPLNYEENDYIEQFKDSKLFLKEYIGEPILNPLISYPDLKTKNSIGIIDLRHQTDRTTPKIFQLFEEHGKNPDNASLFLTLIRRKELKQK